MVVENVRVAVRVRPFTKQEELLAAQSCISVDGDSVSLLSGNDLVSPARPPLTARPPTPTTPSHFGGGSSTPSSSSSFGGLEKTRRNTRASSVSTPTTPGQRTFNFDSVFDSSDSSLGSCATQEIVYEQLGKCVVDSAFTGYNSTLFAYGQTSSGKTYTMIGESEGSGRGIIPRVCEDIFARIETHNEPNVSMKVEVSFFEIFNEDVRDLLESERGASSNSVKPALRVREHPVTGPYVEDLSSYTVRSPADCMRLLEFGFKSRRTSFTNMNDNSSRSHAVFQMQFTQTRVNRTNLAKRDRVSVINLVDLAGSERQKKTGAEGKRLQEAAYINKSLSTLGLVIAALAEGREFVPYRDSVLTFLLKESLGGNAKTIMIAAISPADVNVDESLSTLRFAERVKKVVNKAKINEDESKKIVAELQAEIERLKAERDGAVAEVGRRMSQEVESLKGMLHGAHVKALKELDSTRALAESEAQQRAELQSRLDSLEKERSDYEGRIRGERQSLLSSQAASMAMLQRTQEEYEAEQMRREEMEEALALMEIRRRAAEERLSAESEEIIRRLEAEIGALREQLALLEARLARSDAAHESVIRHMRLEHAMLATEATQSAERARSAELRAQLVEEKERQRLSRLCGWLYKNGKRTNRMQLRLFRMEGTDLACMTQSSNGWVAKQRIPLLNCTVNLESSVADLAVPRSTDSGSSNGQGSAPAPRASPGANADGAVNRTYSVNSLDSMPPMPGCRFGFTVRPAVGSNCRDYLLEAVTAEERDEWIRAIDLVKFQPVAAANRPAVSDTVESLPGLDVKGTDGPNPAAPPQAGFVRSRSGSIPSLQPLGSTAGGGEGQAGAISRSNSNNRISRSPSLAAATPV